MTTTPRAPGAQATSRDTGPAHRRPITRLSRRFAAASSVVLREALIRLIIAVAALLCGMAAARMGVLG